ncbi:hypothetical protein ACFWN5_28280 [Streptomyces sp. NPDC058430]|uniref:hypothetical protein n=1 Tax=Streptomyces sp. NPDC058430 TaxID=3346495 RepID=UPI003659D049
MAWTLVARTPAASRTRPYGCALCGSREAVVERDAARDRGELFLGGGRARLRVQAAADH